MEVSNPESHNLIGVRLELRIEGEVRPWLKQWIEAAEKNSPPARPRRPRRKSDPPNRLATSVDPALFARPSASTPMNYVVQQSAGGVVVEISGFEVRAQQQNLLLTAVPLLVEATPGSTLSCTWTATAL